MIVDLNLHGKTIIIIGGGNEAQKRINSLLKQECKIILISDLVNLQISKLAKTKENNIKKSKIQNTKFISKYTPDMIITTTNDKNLNQKIIDAAKKIKSLHIVLIIQKKVTFQILQ